VFLTWPIWIGPPVLTLAILLLMHRHPPRFTRVSHAATALAPIGAFVLLHAAGRTGQASIVATSGAVVPPSTATLGWWLPPLALVGAITLIVTRRHASTTVLAGAIGAQAAGLWLVAAGQTPYMAIKMTYLAIYPAIACATAFVDTIANIIAQSVGPPCGQEREFWTRNGPHSGPRPAERAKWTLPTSQGIRGRSRAKLLADSGIARRACLAAAWSAAIVLTFVVRDDLPTRSNRRPVLSEDLAAAGQWARAHVPVDCVDYLVGNEYTAYWLHLAVLGNPRISARTGDDATFLTQPSMERWLVPGGLRYAIANLAILPAEIRREVDVVQQAGQAAVIERRGPATCPGQ
jgi:hypothetical protein